MDLVRLREVLSEMSGHLHTCSAVHPCSSSTRTCVLASSFCDLVTACLWSFQLKGCTKDVLTGLHILYQIKIASKWYSRKLWNMSAKPPPLAESTRPDALFCCKGRMTNCNSMRSVSGRGDSPNTCQNVQYLRVSKSMTPLEFLIPAYHWIAYHWIRISRFSLPFLSGLVTTEEQSLAETRCACPGAARREQTILVSNIMAAWASERWVKTWILASMGSSWSEFFLDVFFTQSNDYFRHVSKFGWLPWGPVQSYCVPSVCDLHHPAPEPLRQKCCRHGGMLRPLEHQHPLNASTSQRFCKSLLNKLSTAVGLFAFVPIGNLERHMSER